MYPKGQSAAQAVDMEKKLGKEMESKAEKGGGAVEKRGNKLESKSSFDRRENEQTVPSRQGCAFQVARCYEQGAAKAPGFT